ncbi:hypothetical protein NE237_023354 [Protea cynaroides]|uniref:Uncharacterized protein n=1 Tax=Protea cynaroides TaxID=273540 RepID=A0A9Q0HEX7_9MAGN|nr:hypothetical protein NE237_023354 [Protea cynaroides]
MFAGGSRPSAPGAGVIRSGSKGYGMGSGGVNLNSIVLWEREVVVPPRSSTVSFGGGQQGLIQQRATELPTAATQLGFSTQAVGVRTVRFRDQVSDGSLSDRIPSQHPTVSQGMQVSPRVNEGFADLLGVGGSVSQAPISHVGDLVNNEGQVENSVSERVESRMQAPTIRWPLILATKDLDSDLILERQPFDLGKFIGLPPMEDIVTDIGKFGNDNVVGSSRESTRTNPAMKKHRWLAREKGKSAERSNDIQSEKMPSVEPDPLGGGVVVWSQTRMEEGDLLQKYYRGSLIHLLY